MAQERLRWGLLSTAQINDALIGPIRASERSELVAVASRGQQEADAYARAKGIGRAFGSYDDLLAAEDVDVIYNPLPNTLHAEWTLKALEAGKHVLCEKPMVVSEEELSRLEATAQRTRRVVFEAVKYLHHPQTHRILQSLQSGKWGRLQMVQGWLHFWLDPADRDNIRLQPEMAGGSFWDVGVYPASYAVVAAGGEPPMEVYAQAGWGETGVDVHMNTQMLFRSGCVAQISCSFRSPWREGVVLTCEDAVVEVPVPFRAGEDQRESRFSVARREGERSEVITLPAKDPFLGEVEQMERCVLEGEAPRVPLSLSRAFIRTASAIHASARTRRPVLVA